MKELLDKLSSYNIFNFLVPGAIFAVLVEQFSDYRIVQSDLVVALVVYYFLGMIVSRVGSLILEPLLKKTGFLKLAPYGHFLAASKSDPKLELMSEVNNTYRTICALFLTLGVLKVLDGARRLAGISERTAGVFLLVVLLVMFAFAYRKQSLYIADRVREHHDERS